MNFTEENISRYKPISDDLVTKEFQQGKVCVAHFVIGLLSTECGSKFSRFL